MMLQQETRSPGGLGSAAVVAWRIPAESSFRLHSVWEMSDPPGTAVRLGLLEQLRLIPKLFPVHTVVPARGL